MKYEGGAWSYVGVAGFSAGQTQNTTIALDTAGTPYVVFQDRSTSMWAATVMKYNGGSWENVGIPNFTDSDVFNTSIALNRAGTPYVTFMDYRDSQKAVVMKHGPAEGVTNPAGARTVGALLRIWPDPNHGAFTVHISAPMKEPATVTITNILGEKAQEFIAETNTDVSVRLHAKPGFYFVTAVTAHGTQVQQIIVE